MRSKVVSVGGKSLLIEEKRIRDIKGLIKRFSPEIQQLWEQDIDLTKDKEVDNIFSLVENKLTIIFDGLTEEDLENAYPSEIENLISSFLDVNFTGAKKGMSILFTQLQKN